jgi:hypothetical protein
MKILYCVPVIICLSILSCENQKSIEERLARQYCGSCHTFPEPALLDKQTWATKVIPEMAFRMGLDNSALNTISFEDQSAILRSLPTHPMISNENWELIKKYYSENAPDSLLNPEQVIADTLRQFKAIPVHLKMAYNQTVTVIKHDSARNRTLVGNRPGKLYELNDHLEVMDSIQLSSAPSKLTMQENGDLEILLMGIMDPNEQPKGSIEILQQGDGKFVKLLDSLQRPVDFVSADLDNDGATDYVVCNFGNYTGSLMAFQSRAGGKFNKYVLQRLPGARRIILKDIDGNGTIDILALMAQGDERIIAFYNQGNFQFRMSTLLRFQSVYGSSYFDIADFNNDGKFDILHTSGDNADYSPVLKPYHGLRIFLNSGANDFKEHWFYPMHGASQARVNDFDGDGDPDIAAISFFPDFEKHPEHGFIYFENTPQGFVPQITSLARKGRWITMEMSDVDSDGDFDLVLGSLAFPTQVPADLLTEWGSKKYDLLFLKNNLQDSISK